MTKFGYVLMLIATALIFGACSKEPTVIKSSHGSDKALWQQFKSKNAVEQFDTETEK